MTLNLQHHACGFALIKQTHKRQYKQVAKLLKQFAKHKIPTGYMRIYPEFIWLTISTAGEVDMPKNEQDNEYEMDIEFVYEANGKVKCQCSRQSNGIPRRDHPKSDHCLVPGSGMYPRTSSLYYGNFEYFYDHAPKQRSTWSWI